MVTKPELSFLITEAKSGLFVVSAWGFALAKLPSDKEKKSIQTDLDTTNLRHMYLLMPNYVFIWGVQKLNTGKNL